MNTETKKRRITFAQISDLHISGMEEHAYGVDVRENFLKILSSIQEFNEQIDHIVITGDLSFREGNSEIYKWVKEQLDNSGYEYSVIPGNHDNTYLMKEVFPEIPDESGNGEMFFKRDFGFGEAIFLDTSKKSMSKTQVNWFEDNLKASDKEQIVFMHHPPMLAGIKYMDREHSLLNMADLKKAFAERINDLNIFCGHYHTEKAYKEGNVSVFITPSGFFQIDQASDNFKVGSYNIGWRKITWEPGEINTTVRYIQIS